MDYLPGNFIRTVLELHGPASAVWLERLPNIVANCAQRWSIATGPPLALLSYHYVALATTADGTAAVLKIGFPNRDLFTEIQALRLFAGRGCVRLLAVDPDQSALLLERLEPGISLATLENDEQATSAAAAVMRQLWCSVPGDHPFPVVEDWGRGFVRLRERFGGGTGPLPRALVGRAETMFVELAGSSPERVLLHGDLHHHNILCAAREPWLAIDPKGVVGDPAYEAGALLRNPPGVRFMI